MSKGLYVRSTAKVIYGREKLKEKTEMRAVYIGITGDGKSTSGNMMLGKTIFETSGGSVSKTRKCQLASVTRNGWHMKLVDTPGLLDTDLDFETVQSLLTPFLDMTFPGPHIVFYVIKAGKFTLENKDGLEKLLEMFGRRIFDFTIFVFTHLSSDCTPEMYQSSFPTDLKRYLSLCNNRHIFLPHPSKTNEVEKKMNEMVSIAGKLVLSNNKRYFTNEMYTAHQEVINERKEQERQRLEREESERQRVLAAKIEEENRRKISELQAKAKAEREAREAEQRRLHQLRRQQEERDRQQEALRQQQLRQQEEIARLERERRHKQRNDCLLS